MAQTLEDKRIKVEAGDTLSGIYGANWKNLSGYTGDPTKLQIGTILPAIPVQQNNLIDTGTLQNPQSKIEIPEKKETTYPVITPPIQSTEDPLMSVYKNYFETAQSNAPKANEGEELYKQAETNAGIQGLQTGVSTATSALSGEQANLSAINAQIQEIVNQGTQAQLQLESQAAGKDITTSFLSRQQQEISRQSAIKALPLQSLALASQAKIQGLQGNVDAANTLLKQAQDRVDTLFSIKMQDLQNTRDYQKDLADKLFSFMTASEQRQYDEKEKEDDRAFDEKQSLLTEAQSWAKTALSNGDSNIASALMNPNITAEELQSLVGQIQLKTNTSGKYNSAQDKQIDQINTGVSNNFAYKAVNSAKTYADGVLASLSLGTGLGDIAAINQFQKVIDEGAVTRDQDVKLVQQSQSFINSLKLKIKKLEKGEQLSPQQRTEMSNTVNKLYEAKVNALNDNPYVKAQRIKAEQNGIDVNDTILGQLGTFGNNTESIPLSVSDEDAANIINETLNPEQGLLSKIWSWLNTPVE